jgi:serine/threonine protein phosphatase 1
VTKFFVVSDIHGFFDEMKTALDKAGFVPDNAENTLIVCGDTLDRGKQPQQVIDYLSSLSNCILIKGNHESLMEDLIQRRCPARHDWSNGTMGSVIDLAPNATTTDAAFIIANEKIKPFFAKMVDYFETEHYVFVHSWIPVNCDDGLPAYYRKNRKYSKKEDWREAHHSEWENARWMNPLEMAMDSFGIEKTIVAGHWHASAGWAIKNKTFDEFGNNACFDPFYYEDKLIMIDACTAHTGKVNVLVLEDNFLEN